MVDQDGVLGLLSALCGGSGGGKEGGQEAQAQADTAGWVEAFPLVMNSPDHALFVVEDEGLVAGLVSVCAILSLVDGGYYGAVDLLLLLPDYRRQGLGARLIESAVAWARDRGCKQLRLEGTGPQAATYYRRMGCREIAQQVFIWELQ